MPVDTLNGRAAGVFALVASLVLAGCHKPAVTAPATSASTETSVAAAAPAAADAADAKAFLEGVYAHYKSPSPQAHSFSPMDKDIKAVFDADMVALMAKDNKLQSPDEVGVIDGDWLCDCQDYDTIAATITVQSATATTATAAADFKVFEALHHNSFDLVKANGVWRIHDVTEADPAQPAQPSLRKTLQDEITQLSKPGAKKGNPNEAP